MANEPKVAEGRTWQDGFGIDAAAESMRSGTRRVLHGAARIGGQLSERLGEVPLFKYGEAAPPRIKRHLEAWAKRVTIRNIMRLVFYRTQVRNTLHSIPIRMQLVTNQVRLVLELIDDFAEGTYREVPWHSMAIAASAILYSVSPSDLVPDVIPILGSLDDLLVLGAALKFIEKDLKVYASSKGYDVGEYFPAPRVLDRSKSRVTPTDPLGDPSAVDSVVP